MTMIKYICFKRGKGCTSSLKKRCALHWKEPGDYSMSKNDASIVIHKYIPQLFIGELNEPADFFCKCSDRWQNETVHFKED